jgi:hypothetical protein
MAKETAHQIAPFFLNRMGRKIGNVDESTTIEKILAGD